MSPADSLSFFRRQQTRCCWLSCVFYVLLFLLMPLFKCDALLSHAITIRILSDPCFVWLFGCFVLFYAVPQNCGSAIIYFRSVEQPTFRLQSNGLGPSPPTSNQFRITVCISLGRLLHAETLVLGSGWLTQQWGGRVRRYIWSTGSLIPIEISRKISQRDVI